MAVYDKKLAELLDWVVDIDVAETQASIAAERARSPLASNCELARKTFASARWKATLTGLATGLPSNPWIALPAATADAAFTLKSEVAAAARTALIFDPLFFDEQEAGWELLVPVLGIGTSSQLLRSLGVTGGVEVTRAVIHKYLQKESLRTFKQLMLRHFGARVTRRGVMTKTVPIIGGLIGGSWNYIEVGHIRRRTLAYLDTRESAGLALVDDSSAPAESSSSAAIVGKPHAD